MAILMGRGPEGNGPSSGPVPKKEVGSFKGFLRAIKGASSLWNNPQRERDIRALQKGYQTEYVSERSHSEAHKSAMGEEGGSLGGYLLPVNFSMELMDALAEDSFIYPRARVLPMTTAELLAPVPDVEQVTGTAGSSPLFGNISFSWGSGTVLPETEPKFRQVSLRAWDLIGYAVISNQLLMDTGPKGENALIRLFGKAAAWSAEYGFLNGLGIGSKAPLGILNAPAAIASARKVSSQVATEDVARMASRMLPFSWKRSIWACSPSVLLQLVQASGFLLNLAANQGELERLGGSGALMSRPLFVTDKLPPLGTQGDLIFFDPWLYTIGERQEVLIDVSEQSLFSTNQTVYRIWLRMDGKPMVTSSITLQDQVTVVSPYVILAA